MYKNFLRQKLKSLSPVQDWRERGRDIVKPDKILAQLDRISEINTTRKRVTTHNFFPKGISRL